MDSLESVQIPERLRDLSETQPKNSSVPELNSMLILSKTSRFNLPINVISLKHNTFTPSLTNPTRARRLATYNRKPRPGNFNVPNEEHLLLPSPPSTLGIVDTHTHLALTYAAYRKQYKNAKHEDAFAFARGMYEGRGVEAIVDVWCEAPVWNIWREFADSALSMRDRESIWDGMNYWFVMGKF